MSIIGIALLSMTFLVHDDKPSHLQQDIMQQIKEESVFMLVGVYVMHSKRNIQIAII